MCLCVCVHAHTHTYTHTRTYIYIYIYIYLYIYVHLYIILFSCLFFMDWLWHCMYDRSILCEANNQPSLLSTCECAIFFDLVNHDLLASLVQQCLPILPTMPIARANGAHQITSRWWWRSALCWSRSALCCWDLPSLQIATLLLASLLQGIIKMFAMVEMADCVKQDR